MRTCCASCGYPAAYFQYPASTPRLPRVYPASTPRLVRVLGIGYWVRLDKGWRVCLYVCFGYLQCFLPQLRTLGTLIREGCLVLLLDLQLSLWVRERSGAMG